MARRPRKIVPPGPHPPRAPIRFLFGQYVPRCAHQIDKRFDYCVLQYLDGGAVDLSIDGTSKRMEGRWFWSSYPGPRIAFRVSPPHKTWVHRYLAFQGPAVARWSNARLWPLNPQPVFGPAPATSSDYSERFDQLLQLARRSDHWGQARAILLLESLLTELAEARSRPREMPAWLEAAMTRMQALGAWFDHDDLATEAGMASRTFRRRFTAAVGQSPHDYLIDCRITHAREMLGNTELPIKAIAEQLGYRDISFFTRQFREVAGVPPAAYRRSREA